jgi:cytochrome c-type biogenesis protein CcmE
MSLSVQQKQRLVFLGLTVGSVAVAIVLLLLALRSHITYFYTPSESIPVETPVRLGGIVKEGSLHLDRGSLTSKKGSAAPSPFYQFIVTDFEKEVLVRYNGLLPDLFREGQGIVAEGQLGLNGTFLATKVLAKHDEIYMPPEVADTLKKKGLWRPKTPVSP